MKNVNRSKKKKIEKTILLTYTGIRVDSEGAYSHVFVHGIKKYFWLKTRCGIIGDKYEAEITKKGLTMKRDLLSVHKGKGSFSEKTIKKWELDTKITEQRQRDKRAANKARKTDTQIWPHIEPLNVIYHKLKGFEERDAFLSYVSRLIRRGHG